MSSSKKASTNTATPVPPKKKKSNDATLLSGEDMEFVERSKRHRHPIWKWFQPFVCQDTPEGEDGSEQVSQLGKERMLCPLCSTHHSARTQYLKAHLEKHHQEIFKAYIKTPKKKQTSSRSALEESFTALLSVPSISINIFRHPLMIRFLNLMNSGFHVPKSHYGLSNRLQGLAEEMREQIKVKLSNLEWKASVSLDIWSDGTMKTYMGATISFIDTQDLTLRTLVLGVIRLLSSSTGDYIRQMTSDLLKKYGLSLNSIKRVVTDSAKNMIKAFDADVSTDDEEDESYADDMPRFIEFPALAIPNSQRISCAAHLFQNVLENGMKSTLMKHPGFKAIQKMASTFRKSTVCTRLLEDALGSGVKKRRFLAPSTTRWAYWIPLVPKLPLFIMLVFCT